MLTPGSANPILIELTRGELVESFHRGALAVAGPGGNLLMTLGDIERPVFARSSIKLIQALPLIETGAAEAFGYEAPEIALACGSHVGTDRHVAVAARMIERIELPESALACGPAIPMNKKAAAALTAYGLPPSPLHHQCSGKHIGMLATAKHLGADISDGAYAESSHPVQRLVHGTLQALAGIELTPHVCGMDGCSVPTWALPIGRLAGLFARLATGEGLASARRAAVSHVLKTCWQEPELVAGHGRTETVVMSALPGRIYLKTGAEAIVCGAIPELGVGFALKIDDGGPRAPVAAVMPLIERLIPEAQGLIKRSVLRASNGAEAGTIRISDDYQRALDGLKA